MEQLKINKNYLLLKNWWESIELTNYEKSFHNKEIISFNQQLLRLKEKKIRIGAYGKSGVGKSSVLNCLLETDEFQTDIINEFNEAPCGDRSKLLTYFIENKLKELTDSIGDF